MSRMIYADIVQVLNNVKFKVIVTESYQPVIHPLFLQEHAPDPICSPSPMDENNKCITMVPISYIIDMFVNKTWFAIYNLEDNDTITDFLGAYVKEYASMDMSTNSEAKLFYDRAVATYDEFKKRQDRRRAADKTVRKARSIVDILTLLNKG